MLRRIVFTLATVAAANDWEGRPAAATSTLKGTRRARST